jgi:hypothetical protein
MSKDLFLELHGCVERTHSLASAGSLVCVRAGAAPSCLLWLWLFACLPACLPLSG